jgi:septal ring factor EnvC (AmiA/AmiB activator)
VRYAITLCFTATAALLLTAGLLAQGQRDADVAALNDAKRKAAVAEQRAENLRQEASSAEQTADRVVAQRAALGADVDAANAQIVAARVRIGLIARRQKAQAARLGEANEPLLRLNALLQRITRQPAVLLFARPGDRRDYVHVRATIASVEPYIANQTVALRRQMAAQRELRSQEQMAMKALAEARQSLTERGQSLASLEQESRGSADALTGDAAIEYELAIGQGERARALVEQIDANRESSQNAAILADLDGPLLADRPTDKKAGGESAYIAPARGTIRSGFGEVTTTGYRERGIRIQTAPSAQLVAPAAGTVTFSGRYRSYGNIIIIDHGGGWTTLIAYVEQLGVVKGNRVSKGNAIGTSRADNPEIMVELRRNGRPMDIAAMIG